MKTLRKEETPNLWWKIISQFGTILVITKQNYVSLKIDNLPHEQLLDCGEIFQNASLINSGFLEGK